MSRFSVFGLIALFFLVSSCFDLPEFKGASNFKMGQLRSNKVSFSLDVNVFNPNGYGIKVRPSEFDVFIGKDYVGRAKLQKSFKMKRKKNTSCHIPLELNLEPGMMMKLMKWAQSRSLEVRLEGVLKASVMGVPKREKINETKTINPRDLGLNINLGGMFGG